MASINDDSDTFLLDDTKKVKSPYFGNKSPLVIYFIANKIYDEWASGDDDSIGKLLQPYHNIPTNSIIKILPKDISTFEIYFVDKPLTLDEIGLFGQVDYNFNFFHKIGYPVKCHNVTFCLTNNETVNDISPYKTTTTADIFFDSWLNKLNLYKLSKGNKPYTKEDLRNRWNYLYK